VRLLQVVDDALAAALATRDRSAAETGSIKEAEAQLRSEIAIGLRDLAEQVKAGADTLSYDELRRMLA
jgi:hypothetical protein